MELASNYMQWDEIVKAFSEVKMRQLLLPLIASLALPLPTAVNAEKMSITKTQYSDSLSYGSFTGSMMTICQAEKEGFLSNNEKLEMINMFTRYHKELYKNKTIYNKDKEQILSRIEGLFPNCLP